MLLRIFILLSLIRYVMVIDSNKYINLFRTQRSCSNIEYYDRFQHKCQEFPGGGYLVIVDHSAKCTSGDTGLHTFNRNDFYYVCSPDGVMIGMCPTDMKFNETLGRCVLPADKPHDTIRIYDESENCNVMIPNCNNDGKFPVPSNCSFYYDCQRNNHNYLQYVYKCPYETMYHPDLHRCVSMTKCYVNDHYDILDRFDYDYFPKCIVHGQFRTSRHCNLFYRCIPNMDGSFFQIRYECPPMMYYNIEKERCYMGYYANCEYMPWDKIVKDYVTKHNLKINNCIPKHTTTISTLNTTITTSCPCSCSSTTAISINSTNTYPTTQTTASTLNPYTSSSTFEGTSTVTKSTTSDETDDSIETSSVTEPEFTSTPTTEATDSQETETEIDTTIPQTDETTVTNEPSTTPDTQTETTDNDTSATETSSTEEAETVTTESSGTTTGYSSDGTGTPISTITDKISASVTTERVTSDTTKMKTYPISTTSGSKLPTETTQATSTNNKTDTSTLLTTKQATRSTTKVPYTSHQPTTGNTNKTSTETYTTTPRATSDTTKMKSYPISTTSETKLPTETTQTISTNNQTDTSTLLTTKQETESTTEVSYPSQQPTTGYTNGKSTKTYTTTTIRSKQTTGSSTSVSSTSQNPTTSTTYFTRTSKDSSSEEYDSYEDFTWDDVAWHRQHRTSRIPYGYPTPSTKKPRAHFHPNPPPFDYPDSNYWDDSHSHELAKSSTSARYSSTTHKPSRNSTGTTRMYQDVVTESTKNSSTTRYTPMASSSKPLSSEAADPDTSESNESNPRPVRCYNNRHGGLTCDGVKGKPGGWFELPGYLLRYRKRSGEDTTPDKKMNGAVNLRLRYPNAYKVEAYPKQKRRVKKPDSN